MRGLFRKPSALRRVFRALSPVAYRRELPIIRTAWDFTGHDSLPFSPGGDTHHPKATMPVTASPGIAGKSRGIFPALPSRTVVGATSRPKVPSPGVIPPGPFVTTASSGKTGTVALAAYPCIQWHGSSGMFCTGAAPHRYASTLFSLLSFPSHSLIY